MIRSLLARAAVVTAGVAAVTFAFALPASAHVTVSASSAVKGGYTKVTFRVPNEADDASTVKVEVALPTDTPIASVSLKDVPGWTVAGEKSKLPAPVKTDDGEVTEAFTKITWTAAAGAGIKPGMFEEFDVSLGPLPNADQLVFKALQTYSNGVIVRWIDPPATGGTEPEHPAPVLKLANPNPEPEAAAPAEDSGNSSNLYGIAGILLGLGALITGLLAYRKAAQPR